jgi:citronellol/citronellal dehydrogenase
LALTVGAYGASKAALNRLTNALAVELWGTGVRVNTIEPKAAVMTEGAAVVAGDQLVPSLLEPMETMVEATVALCDCPVERTGAIHSSIALLAELGIEVRSLDGSTVVASPSGEGT